MLDLYTIYKHLGGIDGKTITLVGDLKYGRTTHSLAKLLTQFKNVTLNYVSPPELRMPDEVMEYVTEHGIKVQKELSDLNKVLSHSDVLYVTRIQQERFPNKAAYDKVKDSYVIDTKTVEKGKSGMIVMHPLPRVKE